MFALYLRLERIVELDAFTKPGVMNDFYIFRNGDIDTEIMTGSHVKSFSELNDISEHFFR